MRNIHPLFRRAAPLLVALLALVFFYRLAFTDSILARGDTFAYFYPYWFARSEAFQAGRLPLWSPDLFMGVPLLANSQIGVFYPLNWPLSWLSPPDAVRVSILFHVGWALAGTYLLARRVLRIGFGGDVPVSQDVVVDAYRLIQHGGRSAFPNRSARAFPPQRAPTGCTCRPCA